MRQHLSIVAALVVALSGYCVLVFAQGAATEVSAVRGAYLATAADCVACHTSEGGSPFAGGKAISTPIGDIVASNITPSKAGGIGTWSEQDFARALRHGVDKDGANLYPAMPYTAYAKLTDADVADLYAYFTQQVHAVDQKAPATQLPFPFSIRASMMGWNLLFLKGGSFQADPAHNAEWNRGAYLAEALGHCSTCHTPRNALMAEETGKTLSGASLGTWYAPNITSDPDHGIGKWSEAQIAAYLATGHSGNGAQAGGPMLEAIDKSFRTLTPADLAAIAAYIHSVPAKAGEAARGDAANAAPLNDDVAVLAGTAPEGAQLYSAHCATCHAANGKGGNGLPSLLGNAALHRAVADNVVMAVLGGITPASGQAMPAFNEAMDDKQIATLTNYLFVKLGDAGTQTTPQRVAALRAGGAPSPLLAIAKYGLVAAVVVLLAILALAMRWWLRRRPV